MNRALYWFAIVLAYPAAIVWAIVTEPERFANAYRQGMGK